MDPLSILIGLVMRDLWPLFVQKLRPSSTGNERMLNPPVCGCPYCKGH